MNKRASRLIGTSCIVLLSAAFAQCALSDGDPCGSSTDCRTGYLCYWNGNEGCTQGQCHQPKSICAEPAVVACGCDGKPTRNECGSPGFEAPVQSLDAGACGADQ